MTHRDWGVSFIASSTWRDTSRYKALRVNNGEVPGNGGRIPHFAPLDATAGLPSSVGDAQQLARGQTVFHPLRWFRQSSGTSMAGDTALPLASLRDAVVVVREPVVSLRSTTG